MDTGSGPLPVREIVGIVAQVKERPEESQPERHIDVPIGQDPPWQASLIVRPSIGSASALGPVVRAAVAGIDRERPVTRMRTLADIGHDATAAARFRATLVASFAVLALTLAIVGVFGVLAGLIAAAILGRSMASFLFGVKPVDPITFGGVALLLALTASCAAAVPALRAVRVDPIVVLRDE